MWVMTPIPPQLFPAISLFHPHLKMNRVPSKIAIFDFDATKRGA